MALENVGQQSFSGPSEDNQAQRAKNVCCVCNSRFKTVKELHQHFSAAHEEIQLKHETHVFHSDEDFSNWKKEEEMKSKASFVQRGGGILGRNQKRTMYYICNRSGVPKIKTDDRKRHVKLGGSVKCGITCPAFMKAIKEQEEGIKITVEYQSTHVGHEKEVGKLRLHSDDAKNLAAQMKSGVPSIKIIESIRSTCPPTTRLGLTTKKDLHNICSRYKIDKAIFHKDDASCDDLHVKKMQKGSCNPIYIYKPVGSKLKEYPRIKEKNFMLCLMTESQHDTVLIIDEKNSKFSRSEQKNEAIINEREKSIDYDVIEEGRQRLQNTFQGFLSMIHTEEDLRDAEKHFFEFVNHFEASKSSSLLPSCENVSSHKYVASQKRKKARLSKKAVTS